MHPEQAPLAESQLVAHIVEQKLAQPKPAKLQASATNPRSTVSQQKTKGKTLQLKSFNAPKKAEQPHIEPVSSRVERVTAKSVTQQMIFKSRSHTDLQTQGHSEFTSKGGSGLLFLSKKSEATLAGLEIKSHESKEALGETDRHPTSHNAIPKLYNALFPAKNKEASSTKAKPIYFQSRSSTNPRRDVIWSVRPDPRSHKIDRKGEVLLIQQTTKSSDWAVSSQKESLRKKPYQTINENLIGSLNYTKNQTSVELSAPDPKKPNPESNKVPFYFDKDEYFEQRMHKTSLDQ